MLLLCRYKPISSSAGFIDRKLRFGKVNWFSSDHRARLHTYEPHRIFTLFPKQLPGPKWAPTLCLTGIQGSFSKVGMLFSHSVVSDSLWPHGLQHTRLACPSPSPRVCSNSCPLSRRCYPTISSSVTHFSAYPASAGSFPMSWLFASGGQSIGALASVLPMNIRGWFPIGLTGLISQGLSRVFSSTTIWKHQVSGVWPSLWVNSHICTWLLEKP